MSAIVTGQQIVERSQEWLGAPFHHQGRVRVGCDCVGLVIGVLRELGAVAPGFDFSGYGRRPWRGLMEQSLRECCTELTAPVPGCGLLMRFAGEPQHLAIYLPDDNVIHSYESVGRVVTHSLDIKWKRRIVSAWALPGVTYE